MGATVSDNQRRILLLGALAALLVLATALGESYSLRESTRTGWSRQMDSLSLILAEQAGQTVFSAQTVLDGVVDAVNQANLPDSAAFRTYASTETRFQLLADRANSNPVIDVVTLVSKEGEVLNFSRTYPPPQINLADRDYFQAHRDNAALSTFISVPVRNKGNGKWVFSSAGVSIPARVTCWVWCWWVSRWKLFRVFTSGWGASSVTAPPSVCTVTTLH